MQKSPKNVSIAKRETEVYKGRFVSGLPAGGVGTRVLIYMIINMNKVLF